MLCLLIYALRAMTSSFQRKEAYPFEVFSWAQNQRQLGDAYIITSASCLTCLSCPRLRCTGPFACEILASPHFPQYLGATDTLLFRSDPVIPPSLLSLPPFFCNTELISIVLDSTKEFVFHEQTAGLSRQPFPVDL